MKNPIIKLQEQKNAQKQVSNRSSCNQFDYPTFSSNKNLMKVDPFVNQKLQKQNEQNLRKEKYSLRMREENQNQREKVKQKQQKINQQKQDERKQKILDELTRKKMELQKLEKHRQQIMRKQVQAHEQAKEMNSKVERKRLQSQERSKQEHKKEIQRFNTAIVKVREQKQLKSEFFRKQSQAAQREEVRNLYKSRQREAVQKYQLQRQESEEDIKKRLQEEKRQLHNKMMNSFQHKTGGKSVDFSNSCYHNFAKNLIVLKQNDSGKAKEDDSSVKDYQKLLAERKSMREQSMQENRQKSLQRGRMALKKLQQTKELNNYMEEMQEQQLNYNLERVEAGKKNQYIGMKPETLKTHLKEKQSRAEGEFQKLFIPKNKDFMADTENYCRLGKLSEENRAFTDGFQATHMSHTQRNLVETGGSFRNENSNQVIESDQDQNEQQPRDIYTIPQRTSPQHARESLRQMVPAGQKTLGETREQEQQALDYSMTDNQDSLY